MCIHMYAHMLYVYAYMITCICMLIHSSVYIYIEKSLMHYVILYIEMYALAYYVFQAPRPGAEVDQYPCLGHGRGPSTRSPLPAGRPAMDAMAAKALVPSRSHGTGPGILALSIGLL